MGSNSGRRRPADRMPRRATDRVEDLAAWLLITAGLLLVLLAATVAVSVHRSGVERAAAEAATRHEVPAVLLEDVPVAGGRYESRSARWTGPDGAPVTGRVPVATLRAAGARAGSEIRIWVDDRGTPTRPPATPQAAVQAAAVATVALALAGLLLLGGLWTAVHTLTTRCNAARWEREWARVGPRWSRRVH